MNIAAYKKYWGDADETLNTYSPTQVDKAKVGDDNHTFLTTWDYPLMLRLF